MECFILAYSPFWILWALCILVPFRLYDVRLASCHSAVGLALSRSCYVNADRGTYHKPFELLAQRLTKLGYLGVGLAAALPLVILPLILQPAAERGKPWGQRFWVKSQVRTVYIPSGSMLTCPS